MLKMFLDKKSKGKLHKKAKPLLEKLKERKDPKIDREEQKKRRLKSQKLLYSLKKHNLKDTGHT